MTLVEELLRRARADAARLAVTDDSRRWTWDDLVEGAGAAAAALEAVGRPERVVIAHEGPEFAAALLGCWLAGAAAVPSPAPRGRIHARAGDRFGAILRHAQADAVLAPTSLRNQFSGRYADARTGMGDPVPWLAPEDWRGRRPAARTASIALVQYTSGSTAEPRGAVLGFDEIRANLDAIVDAADVPAARRRGEPHCVSWLPLFHDMGLIGTLLAPWWAGIPAVLLGTSSFGRNPGRWLDRLAEPGAITAAPSFAYRAAAARATAATFEGWHAGFCGAERIENETLREVAKLPGLEGGRTPLIPSYGLAEATLLVTSGRAGSPPTVASFERDALASGRARRTAPGASVITLVGSGAAVGAHRVGIFDPDGGGPREERAVGEIRVSGPSVARGYLRDDAATATTFRRDGEGRRWLRTGDLGFLEGHELFVVGRLKEIVVVRGANHHPQDLEATARDWAPHVTGAVAFPLGENDGDFAVVCEAGESVDSGAIEQSIRSGLIEEHGIAPAFVRVVRAGAIPRTSSGKPRRLRCRELWPAETSAARIAG